jgi:hypothetical protein
MPRRIEIIEKVKIALAFILGYFKVLDDFGEGILSIFKEINKNK